jgi:CheY-like chemotaxis protein
VGSTNNILVIENDSASLDLITETLEKLGASVFTATSADLGISMSQKVNPSLILVNLATPGANGLEICKKLQSEDVIEKIPIYLLTMRAGKFDPAYTKLYGIRGFLKKPLDPTSLLSEIQNYIQMGDYSDQDAYVPTYDVSEETPPSYQEESPQPESMPVESMPVESVPDVNLSEVEDEMALPDELKETLIQAGAGEASSESSLHESSDESPAGDGWSDDTPYETGDETSMEETEMSTEGIGIADEESEEDLFDGTLPHEGEEDESDFEEFLTEETMKVEEQAGFGGKSSLKKTSRISKKILIPAILVPVLIIIAVASYIFIFSEAPTPQSPVPESAVQPTTQAQDVTPIPEATKEPDIEAPAPAPKDVKPPIAPSPSPEKKVEPPTAPSPPPEKKVEPPAKPKSTPVYYVQFGNFGSELNAKKLANQLRGMGLDTFVKKGTAKNGAASYRVLFEKEFKSLPQARNESRWIKKKYRVDSFPYTDK